jgi:hypothetical protein
MWGVEGWEGQQKGGAVVHRPGARVDGHSHNEQKKIVLQVSSKREERGGKGKG